MTTRDVTTATADLRAAGYIITGYPDMALATSLIVQLGDRTVTTLPVKDGAVCEESVTYLVSEAHYEKLGKNNG